MIFFVSTKFNYLKNKYMYTVVISNEYRVFQKFVPIESCTLYNTFYVSLRKIQLGQLINLSN